MTRPTEEQVREWLRLSEETQTLGWTNALLLELSQALPALCHALLEAWAQLATRDAAIWPARTVLDGVSLCAECPACRMLARAWLAAHPTDESED